MLVGHVPEVLFSVVGLCWASSLVALISLYRNRGGNPGYSAMMIWVAHGFTAFTVNFLLRLLAGYDWPTAWMSLWMGAVFAHGYLAIAANFAVAPHGNAINDWIDRCLGWITARFRRLLRQFQGLYLG